MDFEELRPTLLGLAYRLLGSMWDAEDVVQEAWLRWEGTDRSEVREPRAFLITVVSRLALDQLRSARVKREAYTGPWLPEPVTTAQAGPLDTAELRDTVSFATLHMMERLTPPERAVFVLREAFELPYDEISGIVGVSVVNARQLHRRAAMRLTDGRERFRPTAEEHDRLLRRFMEAASGGDLAALTEVLHEDVVFYSDGGGKVRAALRPILGRHKTMAFLNGLRSRYDFERARIVQVNGHPAVWMRVGPQEQLIMVGVRDGSVREIYAILNPDKLGRVRSAAASDL
ncbi:RNA polymerase sigma-70 factor [Nonomuraea cavernae]|uniref:RNA polymerase sigma24 factor n=1 Tax=Nonomuraea cavernae TaxID=2045107 RepID=A0A917Z6X5_9ACTN|nr:RNA polymerase sigma-70 factor [Nonomuraea cavernae]MCA2189380.1 RNA polymerase sigma-70 factor [Nonomuraea cavernae]GGO76954.1 RNA polymerase sigma24 factor [Nonomuraea cavernae]